MTLLPRRPQPSLPGSPAFLHPLRHAQQTSSKAYSGARPRVRTRCVQKQYPPNQDTQQQQQVARSPQCSTTHNPVKVQGNACAAPAATQQLRCAPSGSNSRCLPSTCPVAAACRLRVAGMQMARARPFGTQWHRRQVRQPIQQHQQQQQLSASSRVCDGVRAAACCGQAGTHAHMCRLADMHACQQPGSPSKQQ